MKSNAKTVDEYIQNLAPERASTIEAVRTVIRKQLPKGYEEGMQYGMIGYYVPHSIYPDGYHCNPKEPVPYVNLASQKNYCALYLMCLYSDPKHLDWFVTEWKKTGKKLDMGKSCIRFKKLEDLPLQLIGKAIKKVSVKKFLTFYESAIKQNQKRSK